MTGLSIKADITGLKSVERLVSRMSGSQMTDVQIKAITDGAHFTRRAMTTEIDRAFDRPTAYIRRSIQFKPVTAQRLYTDVAPTYYGGKGIDPQKILDAQAHGGHRGDKRMEVALRRAGYLQSGYQAVIPSDRYGGPFPGSDDGRGNFRGAFITQLLSYLQAQGEVGYRSNMTQRRKNAIHRGKELSGPVRPGQRQIGTGHRFFVSYGSLRGGRTSHLPPGIWAARGTHGVRVEPVVMFTRIGRYTRRYDTDRIARSVDINAYVSRRMRYHIRTLFERQGGSQ